MNTKGTRHIVYSTNRNETKGRFKATLGNTVNGFIYGAVTAHAEYSIESAFASILCETCSIAFTSSEFDLNRFKQGAQFPL